MKHITKHYSNGEVTVVWKPDLCIHSGNCFNGLGDVFDPRKRPWITLDGATTEKIIDQVKKCPSGALSYFLNDSTPEESKEDTGTMVEPQPNGPLLVHGDVTIKDATGNLTKRNKVTAFCRCGGSSNKPFCDGTHKRNGFEG
jgi:uncharacterized Fe-S cluster protein YjdI